MTEPRSRSGLGLLRRLSLRRRRARPPTDGEGAGSARPSPSPSPSPTPAATLAASTSTSTLDLTAPDVEGGTEGGAGPDEGHDESDRLAPSEAEDASTKPAADTLAPGSQGQHGPRPSRPTSRAYSYSADTQDSALSLTDADDDLNRVLLSRLECPVCYQAMAPPIRQCLFGHSVCARCEARLARCPTCRAAFLPASAGNATLNAIAVAVRLPCRHRPCPRLLALAHKARHEERCPHRKFHCPHAPPRCAWRGTLPQLLEHTLREHATTASLVMLNKNTDVGYTYSRSRPFEVVETDGSVSRVTKSLLLVEAVVDDDDDDDSHGIGSRKNGKATGKRGGGDDGDAAKGGSDGGDEAHLSPRALFRLRLSFDATRVLLRTALLLVGPPHLCKMFRYKVSVGSRDGSLVLSAWSDVGSDEEDEALDGVLRVDAAAFRQLVDAEGRFLVRVRVVVCRLPPLTQPT